MLEPIIRDGKDTGFFKQKTRMPGSLDTNYKNILAIQIILGVDLTVQSKTDHELANELFACLSVIKPGVLNELKKILP